MKKYELNIIFAMAGNSIGLSALFLGAPAIMWALPLSFSTLAIGEICVKEVNKIRSARRERLKL